MLNALPLGSAQLASRLESGAAARAAGEPGKAPAGPIKTDAPIDEKKKRRLIEKALTDVFLGTFAISGRSTMSALFRFSVLANSNHIASGNKEILLRDPFFNPGKDHKPMGIIAGVESKWKRLDEPGSESRPKCFASVFGADVNQELPVGIDDSLDRLLPSGFFTS